MPPADSISPPRPPEIPLTFRREIVPHAFRAIRAGASCALVGVAGVGASNLMRFVGQLPSVFSTLFETFARAQDAPARFEPHSPRAASRLVDPDEPVF